MVDQNLLTIFVALTAVAVLIQTGILVGFYLVSAKLSRPSGNHRAPGTRAPSATIAPP